MQLAVAGYLNGTAGFFHSLEEHMTTKSVVRSFALAALVLAAVGLQGASSQPESNSSIYHATLAEAEATTGEVSTNDLRKILEDKSAIVLDTRTDLEFEAGHIPGAHSLDSKSPNAIEEVEQLVGGDRNKALVLYCNGPYCKASRRMADKLVGAGFSNVRRYQLGIPVWRALGGPTVIEQGGVARVFNRDKTAVFIDARSADDFNAGSLGGAVNAPFDLVASGNMKDMPLPEDDFNRRIILFGQDAQQAASLADVLSKKPWHNVSYFPGTFDELSKVLATN
jgi:rhodanese-related sulfurtransferase